MAHTAGAGIPPTPPAHSIAPTGEVEPHNVVPVEKILGEPAAAAVPIDGQSVADVEEVLDHPTLTPFDAGLLYRKTDSYQGAPPHAAVARLAFELRFGDLAVIRSSSGPGLKKGTVFLVMFYLHSTIKKEGIVGMSLGHCRRALGMGRTTFFAAVRILEETRLIRVARPKKGSPVVLLAPGGVPWPEACARVRAGHDHKKGTSEPASTILDQADVAKGGPMVETRGSDSETHCDPECDPETKVRTYHHHRAREALAKNHKNRNGAGAEMETTVIAEPTRTREPGPAQPETTGIAEPTRTQEPGPAQPDGTRNDREPGSAQPETVTPPAAAAPLSRPTPQARGCPRSTAFDAPTLRQREFANDLNLPLGDANLAAAGLLIEAAAGARTAQRTARSAPSSPGRRGRGHHGTKAERHRTARSDLTDADYHAWLASGKNPRSRCEPIHTPLHRLTDDEIRTADARGQEKQNAARELHRKAAAIFGISPEEELLKRAKTRLTGIVP